VKEEAERFCTVAVNRGLLNESQCAILREVGNHDTDLDELLELLQVCGLAAARDDLTRLRRQMAGAVPFEATRVSEGPGRDAPAQSAAAQGTGKARDTPVAGAPELAWFCRYCVAEHILGQDACTAILTNLDGTGDVLRFAQILIDTGLCDDHDKIRALLDKAHDQAQHGPPPPKS